MSRIVILLTAIVLVTTAVQAAGFDVNEASGGVTVLASGSTDVVACAEDLQLQRHHEFVTDEVDGDWMLVSIEVVGPNHLAESCDGASLRLAVVLDDGSVVEPAPQLITDGSDLPHVVLGTPLAQSTVRSISALTDEPLVLELTEVAP